MKKVTQVRYVAEDGTQFYEESECLEYEANGCVRLSPIPSYGTHVPLTDKAAEWMGRGDGSGFYATATKYSDEFVHHPPHPSWATHLIYFSK